MLNNLFKVENMSDFMRVSETSMTIKLGLKMANLRFSDCCLGLSRDYQATNMFDSEAKEYISIYVIYMISYLEPF